MKSPKVCALSIAFLVFVATFFPVASYASIAVTGSDLIGSRSTPTGSGLTGNGVWDNGGVRLEWSIAQVGSDWDYSYSLIRTLVNNPPGAEVSHLILELTHFFGTEDLTNYWKGIFPGEDAVKTYSPGGQGNSNPGLPAAIFGVSIPGINTVVDGVGLVTMFSFTTTHEPVWGDFYAKDGAAGGADNYAYNAGFSEGVSPDQGGPLGTEANFPVAWVPRPNGPPQGPPGGEPPVVPEPMSIAVWSLLAGIVALISSRPRR